MAEIQDYITLLDWELEEGERYDALYADKYPPGGVGFPLKWFEDHHFKITQHPLRVLDVGCGYAQLCRRFKHYVGIDVSSVIIKKVQEREEKRGGEFYVCGAMGAPDFFGERRFDIVFCFDVLEHIPPNWVDGVLAALMRLNAACVLASICTRHSVIPGADGKPLHLTVENQMWWVKKLSHHAGFINHSRPNRQQTFAVCFGRHEAWAEEMRSSLVTDPPPSTPDMGNG